MNNKVVIGLIIIAAIVLYMTRKTIVTAATSLTDAVINQIISFIIKYNEGGYVNDPNDPGGETKYGISKRSYPNLDIKNLTIDQAVAIYRKDYLAKLPVILNPLMLYQVLDMAINAGSGTALKLYNQSMTVDEYKAARLAYYQSLKNFNLYGKSWTNRVNRTLALA